MGPAGMIAFGAAAILSLLDLLAPVRFGLPAEVLPEGFTSATLHLSQGETSTSLWLLAPAPDGVALETTLPDGDFTYFFETEGAAGLATMLDPRGELFAAMPDGSVHSLMRVQGGIAGFGEGVESFRYYGPEAEHVTLTGDFAGWRMGAVPMRKGGSGHWVTSLRANRPMTYKFVVDGMWLPDLEGADELVPDGYGGQNSMRLAEEGAMRVAAGAGAQAGSPLEAELAALGARTADPRARKRLEAETLERHGKHQEAFARREQAIPAGALASDADRDNAFKVAKHLMHDAKDADRAVTILGRLERDARNAEERAVARLDFAMAQRAAGDLDGAAETLARTVREAKGPEAYDQTWRLFHVELWLAIAAVETERGNLAEARDAAKRSIGLSPFADSEPRLKAVRLLALVEERMAAEGAPRDSKEGRSTSKEVRP